MLKQRITTAVVGMLLVLGGSLQADSVTLTATDAGGSTSFNAAGHWDSGAAPASGNDYFTSSYVLRTPTSGAHTFAGDSLTIDAGGTLAWKTTGLITVNDLILNGGMLSNYDPGGDHGARLAGQVTLLSDSTIHTSDSNRSFLLTAVVTGGGALSKTGPGSLTLAVANTYSGETILSGGYLTAGANGALGSGAVALNSGANRLVLGAGVTLGNDIVINGGVSPSAGWGAVTATGGGVLTGTITINGNAANGGHFRGGSGGSVLDIQGAINSSVRVSLRAGDFLISGGGNYDLMDHGAGTVTLGAADGICTSAAFRQQVGWGTSVLDLAGYNQTLAGLASTGTGTGSVQNSGATTSVLTLNVADGDTQTYGESITGDIEIIKEGLGTQVFSGPNSYTGLTTIRNGTLRAGNGGALGSATAGTVIEAAGALDVNGQNLQGEAITTAGTITNTGGNQMNALRTVTLSGDATFTGTGRWDIRGGSLDLAGFTATKNGSNQIAVVDSTISSGQIVIDEGILSLTRSTWASGGVTANAGTTLYFENNSTGSYGMDVVLDTATLRVTGSGVAVGGPVTLTGANVLQVEGQTLTLNGDIGGAGGFTLNGTGAAQVILAGTNSYAGGTTVAGGRLIVPSSAAIPGYATPQTVVQNGGSLVVSAGGTGWTTAEVAALNAGAVFDAGSWLVFDVAGGDTFTHTTPISGNLSVAKEGAGILALPVASSYAGATEIRLGDVVLGVNDTLPTSTVLTIGSTVAGEARLVMNGYDQTVAGLASAGSNTPSVVGGSTTLSTLTVNNAADHTFAGILGGPGADENNLALVKDGAGTLTLSGANTYEGLTTIRGGTLRAGNGSALGSGVVRTDILSGGTLDINGQNLQSEAITVAGTITNTGGGQNNALQNVTLTGDATFTGTGRWDIRGGSLDLAGFTVAKTGTNKVAIVDSTISAGDVVVNEGIFSLTRSTWAAGSLTVNAGATLELENNSSGTYGMDVALNDGRLWMHGGGRTLTGQVALGGANTIQIDGGDTLTLGGLVHGSGSFDKTNSGILTLTQANTYSGGTSVSGGTLRIESDASLGAVPGSFDADNVTLSGGGILKNNGPSIDLDANRGILLAGDGGVEVRSGTTMTIPGEISGPGRLTKADGGTLLLPGANTYQGGTTVSGGVLQIASDASLGQVPTAFEADHIILNGGRLENESVSVVVHANRGITVGSSGGRIDAQDGTTVQVGTVAGTGAFTKSNTGTLIVGDGSGLSGQINLSNGTLAVASTSNLGTGLIDLRGGTITLQSADAGALTLLNELNLATSVTFGAPGTGDIVFQGGLNGGGGAKTFTVNNAVTTIEGEIIGTSSAFTKNGPGVLALSGPNTYSKPWTINDGAVRAASPQALGDTSAATTVGGGTTTGRVELTGGYVFDPEPLTISGRQPAVTDPHLVNYSGDNTWTGEISMTTGGNQYGIASSAGKLTIQSDVVNNTGTSDTRYLTLGGAGDGEISGVIRNGTATGFINVIKDGAGTWVLSGNNVSLGSTTIRQGTLQVGAGGTTGALGGGNVVNDGTLAVNRSDDLTLHQAISGSGRLVKQGAGTLTLTNVHSYDGQTVVENGTLSMGAAALPGGAVAYWNMAEGGGTTVANSVSPGLRDATLVNGPTWVSGPGPGTFGVQFDGSNDYARVLPETTLNAVGSSDFTASAWVKTDIAGTWYRSIVSNFGLSGSQTPFWGLGWMGANQLGFTIRDSSARHVRVGAPSTWGLDNQWHLITGVRQGQTFYLYLDGLLFASASNDDFVSAVSNKDVLLARHGGTYVDEAISGVGVWDRSLSAQEVLDLFEYGSAPMGGSLPGTTGLLIASGANVQFNGLNQAIASVGDQGGAGGTLWLGGASLTLGGSGVAVFSGTVEGPGAIFKTGAGDQYFNGRVGSPGNWVPVTVSDGLVAGTGPIYGKVTVEMGGTFSAGNSPGHVLIEDATAALDYVQTGTMLVEIGGPIQGMDYDWIEVIGQASLEGFLDVNWAGGFVGHGPFYVLTATEGIDVTGLLSFDDTGARWGENGWRWSIVDWEAGGPNAQALQLEMVPEPASLALLALGASALGGYIRRRRR
ncbi:MAG: Autotransporter-associated beta strand repeat protein [Planctomycetes bacterium ADurb.Bin126]|nr:MAG: Autotransporter-associated beta strand repeat protein [Planctomycetes bacterium ADurb.Bin126]HOD80622.1 autotransporter-associated beta strand repeat-containing protein [Phycisphaerae bacterium]HQL74097.1 autotransporter-associated beta strand repeat-containing protein [Phycisphaerae bacterium]